jgi:oligosaccharide repeat unit polymerase
MMSALAIMEKGSMLFIFVCIIFVLYKKRVVKLRTIILSPAIIVVAFYFFNLARALDDSEYQENETLMDFFAQYALSPPVAFCQLMPDITPQFGTNTFETVYLFLRRFGFDVVVKEKLQDFVYVPISTNVYTIFQPFYIDFGYQGIAIFAIVYGVVSGYLYRLFRNGSAIGICLYTYGVFVLLMQFYQENVFLSMVFILQFTIFTILFTQKKIRLSWEK